MYGKLEASMNILFIFESNFNLRLFITSAFDVTISFRGTPFDSYKMTSFQVDGFLPKTGNNILMAC